MTPGFEAHRGRDRSEAVQVFHLAPLAERGAVVATVASPSHADVDRLLKRLRGGRGLLAPSQIRSRDDLHERAPGAVQVDRRRRRPAAAAARFVDALPGVHLELYLLDTQPPRRAGADVDVDAPAADDRIAPLRDLIPVRQVRVRVVLPLEPRRAMNLPAERDAQSRRELHRARVDARERSGERGVEGRDVRVHARSVLSRGAVVSREGGTGREGHLRGDRTEDGSIDRNARCPRGRASARGATSREREERPTHPENSFVSAATCAWSSRPTTVSQASSSAASASASRASTAADDDDDDDVVVVVDTARARRPRETVAADVDAAAVASRRVARRPRRSAAAASRARRDMPRSDATAARGASGTRLDASSTTCGLAGAQRACQSFRASSRQPRFFEFVLELTTRFDSSLRRGTHLGARSTQRATRHKQRPWCVSTASRPTIVRPSRARRLASASRANPRWHFPSFRFFQRPTTARGRRRPRAHASSRRRDRTLTTPRAAPDIDSRSSSAGFLRAAREPRARARA
eukprot:31021-Pelagococcus_subviridis.AAC.1